jgi:hypothetical protein
MQGGFPLENLDSILKEIRDRDFGTIQMARVSVLGFYGNFLTMISGYGNLITTKND